MIGFLAALMFIMGAVLAGLVMKLQRLQKGELVTVTQESVVVSTTDSTTKE